MLTHIPAQRATSNLHILLDSFLPALTCFFCATRSRFQLETLPLPMPKDGDRSTTPLPCMRISKENPNYSSKPLEKASNDRRCNARYQKSSSLGQPPQSKINNMQQDHYSDLQYHLQRKSLRCKPLLGIETHNNQHDCRIQDHLPVPSRLCS